MATIFGRYRFREHCLAIKQYLLLGQGDFIQYLMDLIGPDLSQPAGLVSKFKLAGLLEAAVRASNAQYDDRCVLGCGLLLSLAAIILLELTSELRIFGRCL